MSESDITLSNTTVGKIILDPREITGEGGWHNPYLHIPIKIQLYPTKKEERIALIRLTASLHLAETPAPTNQFGAKISYDQLYNLPNISPTGTAPWNGGAQLLFNLTNAQIKQLEDLRHKPNTNFYLNLDPVIVRVKETQQVSMTLGDWQVGVGPESDFTYLWLAAIRALRIEMAEMRWVENIFKGIGYDRYRLVEVGLPTSDVLVPKEAIEYFESAKKYHDGGNHTACLRECRLALEEIEKHLKVQSHELGTAITRKLGWASHPELTEQAKFGMAHG